MKHKKKLALITLLACFQICNYSYGRVVRSQEDMATNTTSSETQLVETNEVMHINEVAASDEIALFGKKQTVPTDKPYPEPEAPAQEEAYPEEVPKHPSEEGPAMKRPVGVEEHNDNNDMLNFYMYAEFTYWNCQINSVQETPGVEESSTRVTRPLAKDYTRPGFKFGMGLLIPPSMNDVLFQYTWFYNKQQKGNRTTSTLSGTDTYDSDYQSVALDLPNTFHRVDLVAHKHIFLGEYFTLKPGGGLTSNFGRTWWQVYLSEELNGDNTLTTENDEVYWGVGPYFDVGADFIFPKWGIVKGAQWVLYAKAGSGVCWNSNKVNYNETLAGTGAQTMRSKYQKASQKPVIDGTLGLRWEMTEGDSAIGHFSVNVGWDFQNWFDLTDVLSQKSEENVFLQGLTVGLQGKF